MNGKEEREQERQKTRNRGKIRNTTPVYRPA